MSGAHEITLVCDNLNLISLASLPDASTRSRSRLQAEHESSVYVDRDCAHSCAVIMPEAFPGGRNFKCRDKTAPVTVSADNCLRRDPKEFTGRTASGCDPLTADMWNSCGRGKTTQDIYERGQHELGTSPRRTAIRPRLQGTAPIGPSGEMSLALTNAGEPALGAIRRAGVGVAIRGRSD